MAPFTVSSNHVSLDQQAKDALDWLRLYRPDAYVEVRKHFPENIIFSGSWFDTERMEVDPEWGSWLVDAIEETGVIFWEDGEPWTTEGAIHEC